jgi:hypothetical protein
LLQDLSFSLLLCGFSLILGDYDLLGISLSLVLGQNLHSLLDLFLCNLKLWLHLIDVNLKLGDFNSSQIKYLKTRKKSILLQQVVATLLVENDFVHIEELEERSGSDIVAATELVQELD